MHEAMRLNPHAHYWYRFIAGRGYDMLGDLEQALDEVRSATLGIAFAAHIHIASLLVRLGQIPEAKVALSEALILNPQFSLGGVGVWVPHGFRGCDTSAPVELILTLPSRKPLRMRGTIKHRPAQLGNNTPVPH